MPTERSASSRSAHPRITDGPVYNRLGLAYAPTPRVTLGLLRSNRDDNLEFNAKGWLIEGRRGEIRYEVGAMAGIAFNLAEDAEDRGAEANESQYYAQGIGDLGLGDRFAVGVVPTAFRNPRIEDPDPVSTFTLGLHGQYYATRRTQERETASQAICSASKSPISPSVTDSVTRMGLQHTSQSST